jgi:spectinomycin phosphotransferase
MQENIQLIIDSLRIHYNIDVTTLIPLPFGADVHASVYEARSHDGQSYFVKFRQGHSNHTVILELFKQAKIEQILLPIQTTKSRFTEEIDSYTLTVYPFIHGENGFILNAP